LPATTFDTFFACTIVVAAVLIATAFLGTTLEARIASTQDVNKDSYLKAIADRIVANPGDPLDWGTSTVVPANFGLAATGNSLGAYTLDPDKISRLNFQNNASLSYPELAASAGINNIAVGIAVSQILDIEIEQTANHTVGSNTSFDFQVSTSIEAKPNSASLHCYVVAESYLSEVNATTNASGVGSLTVQVPSAGVDDALLIVFARVPFDNRLTSFAVYSFANSAQQSLPSSTQLSMSPLDSILYYNASDGVSVQNVYALSYSYQQTASLMRTSQRAIPPSIDHSPTVLVACASGGEGYFEEWTAYPQVPLTTGSSFENSERNVFTYTVTIDDVLYKLQLSLGAINP
jgi:hypothetical protein